MHRYILQPYHGRHSRYLCPKCQHNRHTFTRYIDTETNTHLADIVGKCDRIESCGYHYPPREYFADMGSRFGERGSWHNTNPGPRTSPQYDTLPLHYVDATTKAYDQNNFIAFLTRCFDVSTALRLARLYKIGTSKHWPGATIFWQIDVNDKVRTGKIMLYNGTNGHRVKQPYNHIAWAHTLSQNKSETAQPSLTPSKTNTSLKIEHPKSEFKLQQCFFGEHLLNTHPFKTIAIAESEKTAIICNMFYPEYIWLAAGSLDGLSRDKCRVLKDRRVILFPDVNGYDRWKLKSREMNQRMPAANFTVDDTLERTATPTERTLGIDIADRWIEQIIKK